MQRLQQQPQQLQTAQQQPSLQRPQVVPCTQASEGVRLRGETSMIGISVLVNVEYIQ